MLRRTDTPNIEGIRCVSAEDIIGLKLQAIANNPRRKLKDLADIQALLEINPKVDWDLIKSYADLFNLWQSIVEVRSLLERP